jgi:uncharacterized coiled-coil DUF342 family protein
MECKSACDRVRELVQKYREQFESVQKCREQMHTAQHHHAECLTTCDEITEAQDWARRNDIQDPTGRISNFVSSSKEAMHPRPNASSI